MTPVSVSFIVPVRDGERYLAECLESILAQTTAPLEVIVVDDGSVDQSAAVAEAFGDPVRCVRRPASGPAGARNHGMALARGELLAFLDADDVALPDRLARQLACFADDPGLQLCDGWAQNFWSPDVPPEARTVAPQERHTHGDAPKPGMIITWLVRRELFDRVGGFDEARMIGEDSEWRDRVDRAGTPTMTVDRILARRRLHAGNLTRTHYDQFLQEVVGRSRRLIRGAREDGDRGRA